ncbi:MAG TPA: glycosyltransferase [Candidatus Omnitrophota bacterium]|nr:glycosyltransferase [Candidatus Omnitrophota bacterium]
MARWKSVNWTRYHQIFTELAREGHNVHVIQTPPQVSRETNFQEIEVEIPEKLFLHEIGVDPFIWQAQLPLNKLIKKGYYSYKCIKEVKRMVKEYAIDVLFLYNIPQLPLMDVKGCVKIFDFADDYTAMLKQELGPLSNPLVMKIGQSMLNSMVEKSDLTLAVSKVLADSIQSKDPRKIHVLPNGVDLDPLRIGTGKDIRAKYKKPIIGFIGSFEYFIDFELILEGARRFLEYTFLLVGGGRDFARVKQQVEKDGLNNVVLTGGVPHADIYKYIDAMDVCLNIFKPIRISHAACPIKLFEYLSMKKPVISTRLEELKYIDQNFLFYADNADELVKAVNTILQDKADTLRKIEVGFRLVENNYQWSEIASRLLDML